VSPPGPAPITRIFFFAVMALCCVRSFHLIGKQASTMRSIRKKGELYPSSTQLLVFTVLMDPSCPVMAMQQDKRQQAGKQVAVCATAGNGCRFPPLKFFDPNIGRTGRIVRAGYGVVLIGAGLALSGYSLWICLGLVAAGAFGLFEAARGWCLMRACGLKTRL